MPNRKADEIKVRLTPDEKRTWQAQAAEEGISLSELVRSAMNQRVNINRRFVIPDGVDPVAYMSLPPEPVAAEADADLRGYQFTPDGVDAGASALVGAGAGDEPQAEHLVKSDAELVEGMLHATVTLNGEAVVPTVVRRTVGCACGKPVYVFCGVCDG